MCAGVNAVAVAAAATAEQKPECSTDSDFSRPQSRGPDTSTDELAQLEEDW